MIASLSLVLLIIVFLREPLLNVQDHVYAPADYLQSHSLTMLQPGYDVSNDLMGDPAVVLHPWLLYNRDLLSQGEIPLWNPYNGGGVPHLANYQSAVFSPFSLPIYLLNPNWGFVVAAFAKLFCLGFFTYLFLRLLGVGLAPAIVGATVFMFSGYNILWLSYHNAESTLVLPAGLYFSQRIFGNFMSQSGAVRPLHTHAWSIVGLTISVTVSILAGHPESFFMALLLLCAFILFQLIRLIRQSPSGQPSEGATPAEHRSGPGSQNVAPNRVGGKRVLPNWLPVAQLTGVMLVAGIVGAGLAAAQLAPFVEYLQNSWVMAFRAVSDVEKRPLFAVLWPMSLLPDLFGNPTWSFFALDSLGLNTNYTEVNTVYLGGTAILLVLLSLSKARRNPYIAFFSGAVVVWLVYAYDIGGAARLSLKVPLVGIVPVTRSQPVWAFSVACCAALYLGSVKPSNPRVFRGHVLAMVATATLLVGAGIIGANNLIQDFAGHLGPKAVETWNRLPGQAIWLSATVACSLLGLIILRTGRRPLVRTAAWVLLVGAIYLQLGEPFTNYTPTIDQKYFYGASASISRMRDAVGSRTVSVIGYDNLIADANLMYGLAMPSSYDAIWIRNYDILYKEVFGKGSFPRTASKVTERGLKLFGVEFVSMRGKWIGIDTQNTSSSILPKEFRPSLEIVPGAPLTQTFTASANRLQAIGLQLTNLDRANDCRIEATLLDVAENRTIGSTVTKCAEVGTDTTAVISFDPIAASRGREYSVILQSQNGKPGNAVAAVIASDARHENWILSQAGETLEGTLHFDASYNWRSFDRVADLRNHTLYEYLDSPSRYYTVGTAVEVDNEDQALSAVLSESFDPASAAVFVKNDLGSSSTLRSQVPGHGSRVDVKSEQPTRVVLSMMRTSPGYLVLTKPFYPGWKAKVNGVAAPVLRANYAFSAIQIGAGESEVEFYYDPDSFRIGVAVTLASLILGIACVFWLVRSTRGAESSDPPTSG